MVSIQGGAANDVFTLSSVNDNVVGGAGDDTFNIAVASLASSDVIDGGANTATTDLLAFTTAADVNDTIFTNVVNIERLTLVSGAATYNFGAQAQEAGITTVTAAAGIATVTINAGAYTTGISITTTGAATNDASLFNVYGGSGSDTIVLTSSGTGADFVQGGAGADGITLSGVAASASSIDTVRINLSSELASGTTVASADTYTNFQDGADFIQFVGGTLSNGAGGGILLTTGTDDLTVAADVYKATTLLELATFNSGSVSSAYILLLDDIAAFDSNAGAGFTGGASAATAQGAVTAAVTYLSGNGIAATVGANLHMIIGVTVDTNNDGAANGVALFDYQEGAADAGIQASELTLIGIFNGVAVDNLTVTDFT